MNKFINKQYVNAPVKKVWEFFSNTDNLIAITPPEVKLHILHTDLPKTVHAGQIIKYKISPLLGIPLVWITEITEVRDEKMFVDEQKKGPYKYWRHEHYFKQEGKGTVMTDILYYNFPIYLPDFILKVLGIRKKLEKIFEYRNKVVNKIFN